MADHDHIQKTIEGVVCAIVDRPEAVVVSLRGNSPHLTFRIWVSAEDLDKFIGNHSHLTWAIQTIATGIGMKSGTRFSVEIKESPLL